MLVFETFELTLKNAENEDGAKLKSAVKIWSLSRDAATVHLHSSRTSFLLGMSMLLQMSKLSCQAQPAATKLAYVTVYCNCCCILYYRLIRRICGRRVLLHG